MNGKKARRAVRRFMAAHSPTNAECKMQNEKWSRAVVFAFCILHFAFVFLTSSAFAQGPDEHWRTIRTQHFRIHFPRRYEAWAVRMASDVESVRAAVVNEVGFSPPQITDILVENPIAEPNGATLPLLDHPR